MGRREKPAKGKAKAKRPPARKSPKDDGARVRDLEKRLAEALKLKTEALEREAEAQPQQAATAEILRVISSSTTDIQPVFDAIVESAVRLCDGLFGAVHRFDGELMHSAAHYNYTPEAYQAVQQMLPMQPRPDSPLAVARAIVTRAIVQVEDVAADRSYAQHVAQAGGFQSMLAVPMLRGGNSIGAIFVAREQPGPFSAARIALLQTFADQAVIAIENVRLFTELEARNSALTEALDQQTATSDILKVISSSPTDEKPVFQAIADSSVRLCAANFAVVATFDGETLHLVAHKHVSAEGDRALAATYPMRPNRGQMAGRAILERRVVHVADVTVDHEYVGASLGNRATLSVPLLRNGVPIGTITIARLEPLPFTEQQVELLKTFADQAVIAIENVRLFTELEARNRDLTATGEILQVISRSPTDVQPVFDTIVHSAVRLCNAATAAVFRVEAGVVYEPANYGSSPEGLTATRARYPRPLDMETTPGVAIQTRSVFHVPDTEDPSTIEHVRQTGRLLGVRSVVSVPMLREGEAIGAIVITRRDPGRFSDAELELLKTFSDQAVIAIENVRLFTELQARNRDLTEALEQQTATSEILRVISSSPTDVQPIFDSIVTSAARLCEASHASVYRFDGETISVAALFSVPDTPMEALYRYFPRPADDTHIIGRVIRTRRTLHIPDIGVDHRLPELQRALGYRTLLAVPVVRDDEPVGAIGIWRNDPKAFSDTQIELLKTFANQAVIAIENVRLFTELKQKNEALAQLEATQKAPAFAAWLSDTVEWTRSTDARLAPESLRGPCPLPGAV